MLKASSHRSSGSQSKREDKTSPAPIRLKLEINTREQEAYDGAVTRRLNVENPWFTEAADIPGFSNEELLATKLRALLQRNKGRDLIDLSHSLQVFENLNAGRVVDLLGRYLAATGLAISRAVAEERMFAKLENPQFLADVRPLLTAQEAARFDEKAAKDAFIAVFRRMIRLMPGEAWARTSEMGKQFKLAGLEE